MHETLQNFEAERLPVPVSPNFEHAICYHGPARFIALFWEWCGDEFRITDGKASFDGCWHAWLEYKGHARCRDTFEQLARRGVLLGDAETVPSHYCVLDREARALYILPRQDAIKLISRQWANPFADALVRSGAVGPLIMGSPECDALIQKGREYVAMCSTHPEDRGLGAEHMHELLRREQGRVLAMLQWMDTH